MQKKIIALALAGLASSAAFAQSNVTIYGRVDYGFLSTGKDNGAVGNRDTLNQFASGIQAGSRLGFRGSEDLGNGMKAIFQLEFGTGVDANTAFNATRNASVGLAGPFGTVIGGRLDGIRYGVFNKYDAFGGGNVGNFTQMTAQVDRANNAIAYISPSFNGLTATLAYSTHIGNSNPLALGAQENQNDNDGDARLTTAMLSYDNGPISATLDFERIKFLSGGAGTAAALDDVRVVTAAGAYDFGVVKLSALYDVLKADSRVGSASDQDVRSWFVSAKAPVGANVVLKATYGRTEDKDNNVANPVDASKWGIGADYNFSKRTNLYASFGSIRNRDNSALEISPAANVFGGSAANAIPATQNQLHYGVRGFDIGIAHKF